MTGGSRGIGAATVRALATDGWPVLVVYQHRVDAAQEIRDHVEGSGGRMEAIRADLGNERDVDAVFDYVDQRLGALGGLVNNAGMLGSVGRVSDLDTAMLHRVLDVNVVGAFVACREAVKRMSTKHGGTGGSIINVSSRAAVLGAAGEYVHYASSKAALDALTVGLAREVGGEGIRVNAVRPGLVDTEIHRPGRLQQLAEQTALARPGAPREVAAAIRWLMSEEASYVTGALLDISGGR